VIVCIGAASGHRESVPDDGLDDPAVRRGRQPVPDAEIHVEDTELKIGYREQSVLLVGKLGEVADLAEV